MQSLNSRYITSNCELPKKTTNPLIDDILQSGL